MCFLGISEGSHSSPGRRRSSYLWVLDKVFIFHSEISPWWNLDEICTLQYRVKFHMNFMWNLQQNFNVFPEILRINEYSNILFSLNSQPCKGQSNKLFQTQKKCHFILHFSVFYLLFLLSSLYFKIKDTREVNQYCRSFKMHICPKRALCSISVL